MTQNCDQCDKDMEIGSYIFGIDASDSDVEGWDMPIFCGEQCAIEWTINNLTFTKYKLKGAGHYQIEETDLKLLPKYLHNKEAAK